MIESLSWLQWINLLAALILFMGPGFALLSFYPVKQPHGITFTVSLSFGLSVALWAILLAWFKLAGIKLQSFTCALIMALGWLVGLWRSRARLNLGSLRQMLKPDLNRLAIWLVAAASLLTGLWGMRHQVAGLGSDSYHHTLIAQLILQNGGLPSNYLPYAPLATFSYHYGFHALVAALDWLTRGIAVRLLVPVTFEFLMSAAVLSMAYLAESVTRSRAAALVSAVITGLLCVFPAFMANWGRFTQLTGSILMILFLGLFWRWMEAGFTRKPLTLLAVMAAGIALAHYRITFMAMFAVLVLLGVYLATKHPTRAVLFQHLVAWLSAAGLALGLGAPWLWLVVSNRGQGYPVTIAQFAESSFSLSRLGTTVVQYPTNVLLLAAAGAAIIWGCLKADRLVIWLAVWEAVMLVFSGPKLLGDNMDTVSVVISSFIPLSLLVGWLAARLYDRRPTSSAWLQRLVTIALLVVSLWGVVTIRQNIYPEAAMVRPNDLNALEWIRTNTPQDALFMVNTFHWDFNDEYIIGSDAGYWLPLLAGRQTLTLPMIYTVEKTTQAGLAQRLIAVDQLEGDLASPAGIGLMRQEGISYIFIGERGGKINVSPLLTSPYYELAYQRGNDYVLKFKPEK
jgi:hypothetical protein